MRELQHVIVAGNKRDYSTVAPVLVGEVREIRHNPPVAEVQEIRHNPRVAEVQEIRHNPRVAEVRVIRHNPYEPGFFNHCERAAKLQERQRQMKLEMECKKLW